MSETKPPLGIMPRGLWKQQRGVELGEAIGRYAEWLRSFHHERRGMATEVEWQQAYGRMIELAQELTHNGIDR